MTVNWCREFDVNLAIFKKVWHDFFSLFDHNFCLDLVISRNYLSRTLFPTYYHLFSSRDCVYPEHSPSTGLWQLKLLPLMISYLSVKNPSQYVLHFQKYVILKGFKLLKWPFEFTEDHCKVEMVLFFRQYPLVFNCIYVTILYFSKLLPLIQNTNGSYDHYQPPLTSNLSCLGWNSHSSICVPSLKCVASPMMETSKLKRLHESEHVAPTPFGSGLTSVSCYLPRLTYVPNVKSLASHIPKTGRWRKILQRCENGSKMSLVMVPFNRSHITSY